MYQTFIQEYGSGFDQGMTAEDVVRWVEDLPPIPDVIMRALRMADDVKTTPEEMADVILADPALASLMLRSANSVRLGHQRQVTTLALAIMVVGMGQLKALLLASAIRRWNGKIGPVERLVWEKALGAAIAAAVLCEQLGKPYRDELYLMGLLHNLGQVVLLSHANFRRAYPTVLARIRDQKEDYITAERRVMGFSHPLVGALVAWKWGFPAETCRAILHYPEPFAGITSDHDERIAILKLAVLAGLAAGYGRPEGYPSDLRKELDRLAVMVGFNPETLEAEVDVAMSRIRTRFAAESTVHS
jgi:HD-like signal output (HDOD) protein